MIKSRYFCFCVIKSRKFEFKSPIDSTTYSKIYWHQLYGRATACVYLPPSLSKTHTPRAQTHRSSAFPPHACVCVNHTSGARARARVYLREDEEDIPHERPKKCPQILRYERAADTKNSGRAVRQILAGSARENLVPVRARKLSPASRASIVGAAKDNFRRR